MFLGLHKHYLIIVEITVAQMRHGIFERFMSYVLPSLNCPSFECVTFYRRKEIRSEIRCIVW